ncbi:hypothetical protein C8R43DRAFT_1241127 [Mycena crocata]|nr:hypothetical protein C8R43DRAFT_1241127 [Mycena crocata]
MGAEFRQYKLDASPAPRRSGSFLTMVLGPNGMSRGKSSIACAICLARHWSPGAPRASTLGADTDSIEIGAAEGAQGAIGDAGAHGVPRLRDRAQHAPSVSAYM